jgi:hypothetical protein
VSGSTALPSAAAPARPPSKSATQSPVPKGLGVRRSSRRRKLQDPGTGSQKNSLSSKSDHARFRVNISMNSVMFNNVSARFPATGGVYGTEGSGAQYSSGSSQHPGDAERLHPLLESWLRHDGGRSLTMGRLMARPFPGDSGGA